MNIAADFLGESSYSLGIKIYGRCCLIYSKKKEKPKFVRFNIYKTTIHLLTGYCFIQLCFDLTFTHEIAQ